MYIFLKENNDPSDYFLTIVNTLTIFFFRLFILRFSRKCYAAETCNKSKLIYHPSPPIAFSRVSGLRSPSALVVTRDRAPSSYFLAPVSILTGAFFPPVYPPRPYGLFLPSANSPLSYGDTYQRDSVENCLLALPAFNILILRHVGKRYAKSFLMLSIPSPNIAA